MNNDIFVWFTANINKYNMNDFSKCLLRRYNIESKLQGVNFIIFGKKDDIIATISDGMFNESVIENAEYQFDKCLGTIEEDLCGKGWDI